MGMATENDVTEHVSLAREGGYAKRETGLTATTAFLAARAMAENSPGIFVPALERHGDCTTDARSGDVARRPPR
jgi:hypothetical protein